MGVSRRGSVTGTMSDARPELPAAPAVTPVTDVRNIPLPGEAGPRVRPIAFRTTSGTGLGWAPSAVPVRRGEHVRAPRVPHRPARPPGRPRRDPLRHRGGLRQPQRVARAGPGDHRRDRGERRPGGEVPDLHGRHAHHRRPRTAVPHPVRARPVGWTHPSRPLRRGAHPVGVARPDVRTGARARAAPLLEPVRPDGDRAAGVPRLPGLQDRLGRARRPAAHPRGGLHRQADDHLQRDGDDRGDRRRPRGRPAGRLHPDGAPRLHRVLPRRPRRRATAVHPDAARGVRHPDRAVRPHGGHRRLRGGRRARGGGPREARDPAPRRRRGRLRLLPRTG